MTMCTLCVHVICLRAYIYSCVLVYSIFCCTYSLLAYLTPTSLLNPKYIHDLAILRSYSLVLHWYLCLCILLLFYTTLLLPSYYPLLCYYLLLVCLATYYYYFILLSSTLLLLIACLSCYYIVIVCLVLFIYVLLLLVSIIPITYRVRLIVYL